MSPSNAGSNSSRHLNARPPQAQAREDVRRPVVSQVDERSHHAEDEGAGEHGEAPEQRPADERRTHRVAGGEAERHSGADSKPGNGAMQVGRRSGVRDDVLEHKSQKTHGGEACGKLERGETPCPVLREQEEADQKRSDNHDLGVS